MAKPMTKQMNKPMAKQMNSPMIAKGKAIPQKSSNMKWIIIAIIVIVILAGLYYWLM